MPVLHRMGEPGAKIHWGFEPGISKSDSFSSKYGKKVLQCWNLVLSYLGDVLRTVLTLYMENEDLPLPTLEEVLICNQDTTTEEVSMYHAWP